MSRTKPIQNQYFWNALEQAGFFKFGPNLYGQAFTSEVDSVNDMYFCLAKARKIRVAQFAAFSGFFAGPMPLLISTHVPFHENQEVFPI